MSIRRRVCRPVNADGNVGVIVGGDKWLPFSRPICFSPPWVGNIFRRAIDGAASMGTCPRTSHLHTSQAHHDHAHDVQMCTSRVSSRKTRSVPVFKYTMVRHHFFGALFCHVRRFGVHLFVLLRQNVSPIDDTKMTFLTVDLSCSLPMSAAGTWELQQEWMQKRCGYKTRSSRRRTRSSDRSYKASPKR